MRLLRNAFFLSRLGRKEHLAPSQQNEPTAVAGIFIYPEDHPNSAPTSTHFAKTFISLNVRDSTLT